jgi:aminobenzoyl-glutamate utilization protein A
MGEAGNAPCDPAARAVVRRAAEEIGAMRIVEFSPLGGSEDATLMMDAVQARGGQATYLLVGTPLPAGHHHPRFDIDEAALPNAVALHAAIAEELLGA